jgi:hypothetical protein
MVAILMYLFHFYFQLNLQGCEAAVEQPPNFLKYLQAILALTEHPSQVCFLFGLLACQSCIEITALT